MNHILEAISKWLLLDDQKELFEILFAIALNIAFLGLATLALLGLDRLLLQWLFRVSRRARLYVLWGS